VNCAAGSYCDLHATERVPGESFWFYPHGASDAGDGFEARPGICYGEYDLPEFTTSGVEGSGLTFGQNGEECLAVTLFEFDLSDFPALDVIANTFGLTVPEWGWQESDWEVCFQKYEFTQAEIGDFDFLPYMNAMISVMVLMVVAWVIRR
jgi:hypothetical protein